MTNAAHHQEDGAVSSTPHAFHLNLPPHHVDKDGVPFITKFAQKKARRIVQLALSIQLSEHLFVPPIEVSSNTATTTTIGPTSEAKLEEENDNNMDEDEDDEDIDVDTQEEEDDEEDNTWQSKSSETLSSISKKCARLQSMFSTLESLKHGGITQRELCDIVLHLLKLLTATVTIEKDNDGKRQATLHYENVGYVHEYHTPEPAAGADNDNMCKDAEHLEQELSYKFALPSPAREVLLSMIMNLLSNKGPLRSASNAAIFPEDNDTSRFLLILHWRVFLRMLFRTAPYLDERKTGSPPTVSSSRQSTVLKRTVQLIRDARHFFDQGIRPNPANTGKLDATARDIFDMAQTDLRFHSHTHACYRGAIMLYLFQPSRCTSEFYLEVLPMWLEAWTSIDRCPEFDFLWMAMFCRARKHVAVDGFDWAPIRKRLLTHCQYWLQLPIGGASMDIKSFPRAAHPRSRSCPSRLKAFVGASSSYEEGIDFVAKVAKLLVTGLGRNGVGSASTKESTSADNNSITISEGTQDVLRFLSFVTPYFNPSNLGSWTFTLGAFLHYFCYELCCRVGTAAGMGTLRRTHPDLIPALTKVEPHLEMSIPGHELVALMDALLPLCQQALYSKNGHVGRAGEASMLYLCQLDPIHVSPSFLDFAMRALDISAVNLSHQAPAALSALTRLIQPALRSDASIMLARLPDLLRLSLAGIDSNDQNKTIRTLILYRSLVSWVPVGGTKETRIAFQDRESGSETEGQQGGTMRLGQDLWRDLSDVTNSKEYLDAISALPESSLLGQSHATSDSIEIDGQQELLLEEAASAMSDWALEFLDRVYSLLRATGEREKTGKTSSGVASRHSSVDVQQARNFSRILKEALMQVFCAMDDSTHTSAVRSVVRFLTEETLPEAGKDAASLCQAAAAARRMRSKDGENDDSSVAAYSALDILLPVLTDDLGFHSNNTLVYRFRCLAGAVRSAGPAVTKHRKALSDAISFALSSKDKHVLKTGCKLLRHTLSSLCESYPYASESMPRYCVTQPSVTSSPSIILGKSAQLEGNPVQWCVPTQESVEFAKSIFEEHVMKRIDKWSRGKESSAVAPATKVDVGESQQCQTQSADTADPNGASVNMDMLELRRCLRVIRYAIRGGSALLPDDGEDDEAVFAAAMADGGKEKSIMSPQKEEDSDVSPLPHETGVRFMLQTASEETRDWLLQLRGRICRFLVMLASAIATESFDASSSTEGTSPANSNQNLSGSNATNQELSASHQISISSDAKVCKEVCDVSLLLLTRRSAFFRSQEAKTVWKAQKQLVTDFALCAQGDHLAESLQRANLYCCNASVVHYKDGEDAGKTIPRRLLVSRVLLFHHALQRNASFEIPRRLRRLERIIQKQSTTKKTKLFTSQKMLTEMITQLQGITTAEPLKYPLDGYEGLVDGLFALSGHSNTHVRASAIGVIDYAITRFGWLVPVRVPRLLSAIALEDDKVQGNAKFGIPSFAQLVNRVDGQGKRKRLAEALRGVCSILAISRPVKELLGTARMRYRFVRTMCGTDTLLALMPLEEMQKIVHYLQNMFNPFRSKYYAFPRTTVKDQTDHKATLTFLLNIMSYEKQPQQQQSQNNDDLNNNNNSESVEGKEVHWRKRLLVGWFLTAFVDQDDLKNEDNETLTNQLWGMCIRLLESEMGQPLQRVILGLFGRLIYFAPNNDVLQEQMVTESFCQVLGKALVYDRREDASITGGHDAQWSAGVEDFIRDSSRNLAIRSFFPFQRTNQSSGTFKVSHAQLVEAILLRIGHDHTITAAQHLLKYAQELAGAPPSEDQRNQQCTSAELFAGVGRAFLQTCTKDELHKDVWKSSLLPFLDEAIPKIPISLSGAYFDAFRYAIQFAPPAHFYPLTEWLCQKVAMSLWQPSAATDTNDDGDTTKDKPVADDSNNGQSSTKGSSHGSGTDGFTTQSKWLYLCCAVLIEIDETTIDGSISSPVQWYVRKLVNDTSSSQTSYQIQPLENLQDYRMSWKLVSQELLPRILEAVGHPYESCRDHISGCMFRICYCHRTMLRKTESSQSLMRLGTTNPTVVNGNEANLDPGSLIVQKLLSLSSVTDWPVEQKYNALMTARRFFSYCIHLGEAKHEFSDYLIPLLPLAFETLKATVDDEGSDTADDEENATAKRALEAEVVKGYRYTVAEVSVVPVISYGRDEDMSRVLAIVDQMAKHEYWQVRHASAHFLRCFQGGHKFLFTSDHAKVSMSIVANLLADERREVSSAAMSALTGILAATPLETVSQLVTKYVAVANRSTMKKNKKKTSATNTTDEAAKQKEQKRARNQQTSVFFLCAAVLAQPYDTPPYVPEALAAISKHSFERNAPLSVRDIVKKCCAEYKRTHMSDNWELHRKAFQQEQLEALEDVVSSPHYYA